MKSLKQEIDEAMREVESMDDDYNTSTKKKQEPQYPIDLMDKLWDEYHDTRDGKIPLDKKFLA